MKTTTLTLLLLLSAALSGETPATAVSGDALPVHTAPREIATDADPIQDTLTIDSATQQIPRILLIGQEYHQAGTGNGSTDGLALLLGVNRPGNRQLWLVDSTQVAPRSTTNTALRFLVGDGLAHVSALATDGLTKKNLILNGGGGLVAIGMTNPSTPFEVRGSATSDGTYRRLLRLWDDSAAAEGVGAGIDFAGRYNAAGDWAYYANVKGVKANAADGDRAGNLVISTQNANGTAMEVVRVGPASFAVTGDATFTGAVTGGNIQAKYQDLAEWVPSRNDLEPGTVVVLDPAIGNGVMASTGAYDTTVAGVVSGRPGIILGEAGDAKEQIATTGRVRVRVDATRAPIRIGDLLVTSDTPGSAMRSEPMDIGGRKFHQPGTIIGKALEPLDEGTAQILVLLSLQ